MCTLCLSDYMFVKCYIINYAIHMYMYIHVYILHHLVVMFSNNYQEIWCMSTQLA